MGSDRDSEHTSTGGAPPTLDAERMFPRLELPPVPSFRSLDVSSDEVVPLRDEPVWLSPSASALDPELQYRAMVERVAALAEAQAGSVATPEAVPEPMTRAPLATPPTPAAYEMPELATEVPDAPVKVSVPAIAIMVAVAALLAWASRMAFSPALLAFAGLLVAQLAAAAARSSRAGSKPLVLGGVSLLAALLAVKGGLHGFSEMAFVAGLFVLVAVVPTFLLLGVQQLLLRRRGANTSPVDAALRDGWKLRFGALLAVLVAGVQAHRTFSAVPDAIVTFGIVALIAITLVPVLRSRGASSE